MRLSSRLSAQLVLATALLLLVALVAAERRFTHHITSVAATFTPPLGADGTPPAAGDPNRMHETATRQALLAMRRDVVLVGLFTFVVGVLIMRAVARRFATPIMQVGEFARQIVDDPVALPVFSADMPEANTLAARFRELHEQRTGQRTALTAEQTQFAALTDALHEGVVAVDAKRNVFRVNQTARTLLRLQHTVPFSADLLPRDAMLINALTTVISGGSSEPAHVHVGDRVLSLAARPLPAGGALLAFYDLTLFRRLESVRRDFVANVSHELRTPLTVVRGAVETLQDADMPADVRAHFLRMAESNVHRMQRIVDDLLDLSRIESGGWLPDPVAQDVAAVANEIASTLSDAAQKKNVTVRVDVAPDATTVFADPTAVRQILTNLAENALRHTDAGEVVLFSAQDDRHTHIGVRDTGTGIDAVHLPRIFERFYRADPSRSREAGGTGLGLAIVKHLAEAHGGSVRAESTPQIGTTITVSFPVPSDQPVDPRLRSRP